MAGQGTELREWRVSGMDCASCATKVIAALERLPGVSDVQLRLMSERLSLRLAADTTSPEAVERAVQRLGYGIEPRGPAGEVGVERNPESEGRSIGAGGIDSVRSDSAASQPAVVAETDLHSRCAASIKSNGSPHPHESGRPSASGQPASGAPEGETGRHPHDHAHSDAYEGRPWYLTGKGRLVLLSGGLLALAWVVELLQPGAGRWAFLAACLIGVVPVARRAVAALAAGQPFTIESLMSVATLGALVLGAAEEAAVVVFLFAVGEVLEGVAAAKARSSIRALAALVPRQALLLEDGQTREVPAESLQIGQQVLVRPGERLPADGVIVAGASGLDESPVTGESLPVPRGPGEPVLAGSINGAAALTVQVSRRAEDNTIARIVRLIEEAEATRAPTERFIDRFSRLYMPAVVGLAVLVAILPPLLTGAAWQVWIYRALALLLIGCPCALVISVPAALAASLSAAARRGLLMKGGAVVEAAAGLRVVAFDKTGTLTLGQPQVTDLAPAPGVTPAELLGMAAAVETGSSHPLAQAVLRRAAAEGVTVPAAAEGRALAGRGVSARVGEVEHWVASPTQAQAAGALPAALAAQAEALEAEGKTVVVAWAAGEPPRPLGLLALRDEPRPEAVQAMAQLRQLGLQPLMLTGDNPRTAAAIAAGLGMEFRAGMLPGDKLEAIRALGGQGGVMMVGDGINDAPALRAAAVGVAMGSGTDVALETADAAILRNRLTDVAALVRQARASMANIHQNVALALGLKGVFLLTTVLGITGLWPAVLADTGATVLVTLNALRLLRLDPERAS